MQLTLLFILLLFETTLLSAVILFALGIYCKVFWTHRREAIRFLQQRFDGQGPLDSVLYEVFLLAIMGFLCLAIYIYLSKALPPHYEAAIFALPFLHIIPGLSVNTGHIKTLRCPRIRIFGLNLRLRTPRGPKHYIAELSKESRLYLFNKIILSGNKIVFIVTLVALLLFPIIHRSL